MISPFLLFRFLVYSFIGVCCIQNICLALDYPSRRITWTTPLQAAGGESLPLYPIWGRVVILDGSSHFPWARSGCLWVVYLLPRSALSRPVFKATVGGTPAGLKNCCWGFNPELKSPSLHLAFMRSDKWTRWVFCPQQGGLSTHTPLSITAGTEVAILTPS